MCIRKPKFFLVAAVELEAVLMVSEGAASLLTQQKLLGYPPATEGSFVFLEFVSSLLAPVSRQPLGVWLASD